MASFKDATDQEWPVVITYGTLLRAKAAGHPLPAKMEDLGALAEHLADPWNLFEVLYLVCEADKQQLSKEDFAARLDGDAGLAGLAAVTEAAIEFFPYQSREEKSAAIAAHRRTRDRATQHVVRKLESFNWDFDSPAPSASPTSPPTPSGP